MSIRDWFIAPPASASDREWAPPAVAPFERITARRDSPTDPAVRSVEESGCAAVIGPPGEAEPVAAALALALRPNKRAAATAVIVLAAGQVPLPSGGGVRGARRLAARLAAHDFDASARGRLAWAYAPPEAASRAVVVAGAPAVLAVTVPLTAALEAVVADQDLVVVVARDHDGPLARIAIDSLARPGLSVTSAPPLARGLPRLLARAGIRAPIELRRLI